jgi:hypothetical protein
MFWGYILRSLSSNKWDIHERPLKKKKKKEKRKKKKEKRKKKKEKSTVDNSNVC